MQIRRTFPIHCTPDAAWAAIHSPQVAAQVYAPLLSLDALTPIPEVWESGTEAVMALRLLGRLTVGTQTISIRDGVLETSGGVDGTSANDSGQPDQSGQPGHQSQPSQVRIMRDTGTPLTGPLAGLTRWDHRMAVTAHPTKPGQAIWHDRLVIAGTTAPILWPGLWLAWQVREARIRQLAKSW